jgi:SWI/SNF-related matrix-associated actin-dependent regulator 1 of chromatin subfamily A
LQPDNWVREIERWCPTLTYRSYYGGQAERYEAQDEITENIESINVIVTTYNMATGNKDDRSFLRKLRCVTMILDEGHMVKNMESSRYKHLSRISAPFRLLLTGTPLQNNLMELLSLLHFVLPDLFSSDLEVLSKIFAVKSSQQSLLCKQRTQRAKEMMAPFVLRRRKDQVVKELPQKIISIQQCPQTDFQAGVYEVCHLLSCLWKEYSHLRTLVTCRMF